MNIIILTFFKCFHKTMLRKEMIKTYEGGVFCENMEQKCRYSTDRCYEFIGRFGIGILSVIMHMIFQTFYDLNTIVAHKSVFISPLQGSPPPQSAGSPVCCSRPSPTVAVLSGCPDWDGPFRHSAPYPTAIAVGQNSLSDCC